LVLRFSIFLFLVEAEHALKAVNVSVEDSVLLGHFLVSKIKFHQFLSQVLFQLDTFQVNVSERAGVFEDALLFEYFLEFFSDISYILAAISVSKHIEYHLSLLQKFLTLLITVHRVLGMTGILPRIHICANLEAILVKSYTI
tara:strand:+ start:93 stop:518 length:426 start_codon:yes stop_codon:yes gene_type:complete